MDASGWNQRYRSADRVWSAGPNLFVADRLSPLEPGTGLDLKPSKIRGVDSNGMLCSERELELSEDHAGIIDLPEDTPIGLPAAKVLGIDDPVIEIKDTVQQKAQEVRERGKQTITHQLDRASEALDNGKKKASEY